MSATHRRVYSRPPVDGSEEGLEDWATAMVDAILGPEHGAADSPAEAGPLLDFSGSRDDGDGAGPV